MITVYSPRKHFNTGNYGSLGRNAVVTRSKRPVFGQVKNLSDIPVGDIVYDIRKWTWNVGGGGQRHPVWWIKLTDSHPDYVGTILYAKSLTSDDFFTVVPWGTSSYRTFLRGSFLEHLGIVFQDAIQVVTTKTSKTKTSGYGQDSDVTMTDETIFAPSYTEMFPELSAVGEDGQQITALEQKRFRKWVYPKYQTTHPHACLRTPAQIDHYGGPECVLLNGSSQATSSAQARPMVVLDSNTEFMQIGHRTWRIVDNPYYLYFPGEEPSEEITWMYSTESETATISQTEIDDTYYELLLSHPDSWDAINETVGFFMETGDITNPLDNVDLTDAKKLYIDTYFMYTAPSLSNYSYEGARNIRLVLYHGTNMTVLKEWVEGDFETVAGVGFRKNRSINNFDISALDDLDDSFISIEVKGGYGEYNPAWSQFDTGWSFEGHIYKLWVQK